MTDSVTIAPYEPGDEAGILDLRRTVFGGLDPVRETMAGWQWQFEDNPAGPGFAWLAWDRSRVVGQYAAMPVRMRVDGTDRVWGFSCDTMVHPDYRGRGLFVRLATACYQAMEQAGITTAWGFPNAASLPGFAGRLGWRVVTDIPTSVALPRLFGRQNRPDSDLEITPLNRFGPEWDRVWAEHAPEAGIIQVRDAAWLNWRYTARPEFGYRCFSLAEKGRAAGYFVLRRQRIKGVPAACLVDFFPCDPNRPGPAGRVASAAASLARNTSPVPVVALVPHTVSRLFRRAGFRPVPPWLSPKPWTLAGRNLPSRADAASWTLTLGDTDVV